MSPGAIYERIESNIGEGTYGKVHKAKDRRTEELVAIKKAKVSAADRDVGGISFTALREIKVMQAVRHPNVMGFLNVYVEGGSLHLVMEFMDGDLKKVIEDKSLQLQEAHVKCLTAQLLSGLAALHSYWFVHRDVTPTNVLLNFRTGVAKLSDFGFTRTIGHNDDKPMTGMCTTLWYRAPELLYGAKFYGQAVDIWSTGCLVAELFTRSALFPASGEWAMLTKIFEKRGSPSKEVWRDAEALPNYIGFSDHPKVPFSSLIPSASPAAHLLLEGMLALDPKQRPAAQELLAKEFFKSARPYACEPGDLPFVGKARFTD